MGLPILNHLLSKGILVELNVESLFLTFLYVPLVLDMVASILAPGTWMGQVFDFPVRLSTCSFLRLPEISPFSGQVHDEADPPLFCLL